MTKKYHKKMDSSLLLTYHISGCIVQWNGVINSLILQGIFSLSQNVYHATKKKQSWNEINEWMNEQINESIFHNGKLQNQLLKVLVKFSK